MNASAVIQHLSTWMKDYVTTEERDGFVVGVSGGVDSAVASTLACLTGMPVLCLFLPIHQHQAECERAQAHLSWLTRKYGNAECLSVDLTALHDALMATLRGPHPGGADEVLAEINTKSRSRLAALYYYAAARKFLVLGTGNRVEQRGVGFFAKFGDGGMDLAPMANLYKTEVYELARALGVEQALIDAAPTDGLWPDGRTDMDQLGATYPELEWAMDLRDGAVVTDDLELSERQKEVLRIYDERHADNEHKRRPAPEAPIPWSLRCIPASDIGRENSIH